MKSIVKFAFFILAAFCIQFSYAGGADWKEMNTFHSVMSKTFHPAEEGKFQPVRDNAADLLAKAKTWKASIVPANLNKEQVTKSLDKLVAKCTELNKAVKAKKGDEDLKKLITEAHDIFHEVAEKCMPDEHGHEGHTH